MTGEARCTTCNSLVQFSPGLLENSLTCPRCRAQVDNPRLRPIPLAPLVEFSAPVPLADPVPLPPLCANCYQQVETVWRYCPSCGMTLLGPPKADPVPGPNPQAVRSGQAIVVTLGLLGALLLFLFGHTWRSGPHGEAASRIAWGIGLGVLGLIAVGLVLIREGYSPAACAVGRGLLRAGACSAAAVLIPVITLLASILGIDVSAWPGAR